jgi:hypothetical protein
MQVLHIIVTFLGMEGYMLKKLDHFTKIMYCVYKMASLIKFFNQILARCYPSFKCGQALNAWAEIHQALLSHFSFLAEFLIGKVLAKDKDSRALKLVNLNSEYQVVAI